MADSLVNMVRAEITGALARMAPERFSNKLAIEGDQDLLEFVDSFGFVQLLMAIEEPLGIELDLTTTDLGSIVRFDDLIAFILKSSSTSPAADPAGAG